MCAWEPTMIVAPAAASFGARASWFASGDDWPSVPQCMKTTTTLASRLAARTALRVRRRLMALASPARDLVATHDDASCATCDTPTNAILVPLIVATYGAQAAAASVPMPMYGSPDAFAAANVSASPVWP